MTIASQRHRVVVIGSGFGGLQAAKALKRADVDITLISRTTTHLFQPLLYQVATGILSEGEIAPTTRLVLRKQKNVTVRLGEVEGIDLEAQTVTSKLMSQVTVTPYDSLIVAAGAQQSYFGNDHFATFAPGMKTIDDALELRGRILGAFEAAEVVTDPAERERRLTFVVVGAGPTGVELAGQIAELAERTLAGAFRSIKPQDCRVILLDAAPAVLPPMGAKLGAKPQKRLEKLGVEIQLNAMVSDVDYKGITVKGHPNVFVVGDLMAVQGVPGMAQGAIQGAAYAANLIKRSLAGEDDPANREPFKYWDKGSMATVSRFDAVAQVPVPLTKKKLEFAGPLAWLSWLVLHLVYLVGYKNRVTTLFTWFVTFLGRGRAQMAITSQMIYARTSMQLLQNQLNALAAADKVE